MTSAKLSLQGDSGAVFEIDCQAAKQSSLIKTIIEQTKNEDGEAIPISNVDDHVLCKVIEWCEHHQNDTMAGNNDPGSSSPGQVRNIDEWDQYFFGDDKNTIFEIILAANYLEIQPLLDMGCLTIAKKIAGKSLEAIRAEFAIPDLPLADPAASSPPPNSQPSAADLIPPSGLFNPTPTDVRNARLLLHNIPLQSGRILPAELADAIVSLAYRPLHVARRAEQRAYPANDFLRPGPVASVAGLYLSTAPLPHPPAVGTAVPRRVVFQTRAADQGWADAGGHGTFRNSHTWFEVSIVRPVRVGEEGVVVRGDELQAELVGTWETPGEVRVALNERGWEFVENADGGVVWRVSNNMTACGGYRDYRVMWERGVETQVQDERAVGKGHGFLERLESGFVVLLWARAEQRAWVNKVGAASIEVEYLVQ